MNSRSIPTLTKAQARSVWLHAQKLDQVEPFGRGPEATKAAVEHLGYVQIDTIHVIERSHHHILYSRIPNYRREDLRIAQAEAKSVMEYWTHALSYVPTRDLKFFLPDMKRRSIAAREHANPVRPEEFQKVDRLIRNEGAISIRDIDDDELVEKNHPWASRKPSKRALQLGFYTGRFVISERIGMLKKYELADRHFGWSEGGGEKPQPATEKQVLVYQLDRALRSQGLVSLDSICHLVPSKKPLISKIIASRVKAGTLREVRVDDLTKPAFWLEPHWLDWLNIAVAADDLRIHLLSPFDPLTIQRKRLEALFNYVHRFEAYVPKEKRKYGYFALPVLAGDRIVAAIDLKTDREKQKLRLQKWTWINQAKSSEVKRSIDEELGRFEKFQLGLEVLFG